MAIEFQCDSCHKSLRAAADKAGRTARCPRCGKGVTVPQPVSVESSTSESDAFEDVPEGREPLSDFTQASDAPPRLRRDVVEITCPMCGAVNESTTDRCLACGEMFDRSGLSRGTSLKFGDIWNRAWEVWSANLGLHIAAILIVAGVLVGGGLLVGAIYFGVFAGFMAAGAENSDTLALGMVAITFAIFALFCGVFIAAGWLLQLGLTRFAIQSVRSDVPRLADIFDFRGRILGSVFGMLGYSILYVFCFIPGGLLSVLAMILWASSDPDSGAGLLLGAVLYFGAYAMQLIMLVLGQALLWPIPYMLADRRTNLLASVIDGPRMAISHFSLSLLLVLVNFALNFAGSMVCYVGLLFTIPLGLVLFAVAYERCRLQGER